MVISESVRLITVLVLVTLISVAALSLAHSITRPTIVEQRQLRLLAQIRLIFPEAVKETIVGSTYEIYGPSGLIGHAVLTTARGYSAPIELLVGIDLSGMVAGVAVLNQQETPGLGLRIANLSFLAQFKGKGSGEVSLRKYGGKIDGITGATVSSNALTKAVESVVGENYD